MALPDSPLTRGEQYLSAIAGQDTALPNVPLTRTEQYLAKIAGQDVALPDAPLTRIEAYLDYIAENGGGSSVTVEPLTVTQNGTQTAPSGTAYSPVTVNVPQPSGRKVINIYQNGTTYENIEDYSSVKINVAVEAPQGTTTITSNGTVNVSEYADADVNVEPTIVYLNDGLDDGTATLANPFDGLNYQTLMYGMSNLYAVWNAFIAFQFQGMDVLFHPFAANNTINAMAFLPNDGQGNPIGAYASWNSNGILQGLYVLSGGQLQDLRSIAANIPCTTIIYGTNAPPPAT